MSGRQYDGPALDATEQYITEAPAWRRDGETVEVVGDEANGSEETTNVPLSRDRRLSTPDVEGQSTWADWGGEAP